ncbi:MAG: hypothetical protein QXM96_03835 [Candidatus Woesearchaeota archaeon]
MSKRDSFKVRLEMLFILREKELTFTQIKRKIGTNYETIKKNSKELEFYDFIYVKKEAKHKKNGKYYYKVGLTEKGFKIAEKINHIYNYN